MKTPEEIKKGLWCCANNDISAHCGNCPYNRGTGDHGCIAELNADALALIQQLERERDAAIADILRECHKCKHFKVLFNGCTPDYDCDYSDVCEDNDHWQWRGVQTEPPKEV